MQLTNLNAKKILEKSTVLFTKSQIDEVIVKLSSDIVHDFIYNDKTQVPVFLTVMNGGLFFCSSLLRQIKEPIIVDYIHASRYGNETFGSSHITWYRQPRAEAIKGKDVYIVDDILDEGHTLAEIKRFIISVGARSCKLVALIDKNISKTKPVQADYVGLNAPNHFLFGYGMDIHEMYRQLPEVYMYNE